jgi:phenylacetic acid degradation operon negative regulatory protein
MTRYGGFVSTVSNPSRPRASSVPPTLPPPAQPRALIVTVYGLYGREDDGWLPVSGLIQLMAGLDVDETSVRSAISRLKRRGLLEARKRDTTAGYALSEGARAILDEGDARIFDMPTPKLSDGWLLVVFSVPETERAKRHTLRSQLIASGFGAAAPGVWVAPAHRFAPTVTTLERYGLSGYVDMFRAEYLAFGDIGKHARDWWDLDGIADDYRAFLRGYQSVVDSESVDPFPTWVRAMTAWRRLPYRDPGLPVELLPDDWPGAPAWTLLATLRDRFAPGAAKTAAHAFARA